MGRHRRVPRRHLLSFVAIALVAVSSCAGATSTSSSNATGTSLVSGTTVPTTPANARWTPLSPSPISNRSGFVSVFTGTELLVCCGSPKDASATTTSAAAFNPTTNTWRALAAPPTPVESWGAITVADQTIYFLDGGTAPWSYAAYDITADRWRAIPPPPGNDQRSPSSRLGPSVWTGKELVAPISTPPAGEHDLQLVAFDPATDTWRTLSAPTLRLEPTSLTFYDGKITMLGAQRGVADQGSTLVSATYDVATDSWNAPQQTPLDRRDPVVVSNGDHSLAWDVSGSVRVQDGGVWRDLPPIPFPEDECGWKGAQLDKKLVLWRCTQQGAVLDTDSGVWSVLPTPPAEIADNNILSLNGKLVLWAGATEQLQPYSLELG